MYGTVRRARIALARYRRRVAVPVPPAPLTKWDVLMREIFAAPVVQPYEQIGVDLGVPHPRLERMGEALPRGVTIDTDDYYPDEGRFAFLPLRKLPPDELRCMHFNPLVECTDPRCVAIVQRFRLM